MIWDLFTEMQIKPGEQILKREAKIESDKIPPERECALLLSLTSAI